MALTRRTLLAAAGAGLAAWACSTPPGRFRPVALEPGARVRDVRLHDGTWWACGSVLDGDLHEPRLWRGDSPGRLAPVELAPVSFYGQRSELYSLAVGDLGLVAIGAQTGGFHAMPRSASWLLDGDVLVEQPAEMELYGGPRSLSLAQAAAGTQFVLVGSRINRRTNLTGACAWSSPDGTDFVLHDDAPGLRAEAGEQSLGTAITALASGAFVAVGDGFATDGADVTTHARAWWSTDPASWARADVPVDAAGGRTSMTAVAAGPRGALAGGSRTRDGITTLCTWSSSAGQAWQVQPIDELTTDVTDTVSVVTALAHDGDAWWLGARLGRTPILATSPDGQRWFRRALPANVPASAQVRVVLGADRGTLLIGIADLADAATLVGPR